MSDQPLKSYVWLDAITQRYTEEKIELKIKKKAKVTDFILLFIPGETEAIVICNNEEDAAKLTRIRSKNPRFHRLPFHLWPNNHATLELQGEIPTNLLTDLQRVNIEVHVNRNKNQVTSLISAPTYFQCKYAAYAIRQRSRRVGTTIEVTHPDVWNTAKILKSREIKALEKLKITTTYDGNVVTFNGEGQDEDINDYIQVIEACIKSLHRMYIEEVKLTEKKSREIRNWCAEIESEQERNCCAFNGKREVFVFDYTYSDWVKIKHKLLLKDGQRQLTGRGSRKLHAETSSEGNSLIHSI